jgi:transglutaminase-like putative cysteine protease/tetratricopeptide (TPR) repeat protein
MKFCSGVLLAASSLMSLSLAGSSPLPAQATSAASVPQPATTAYSGESSVFEHLSRVYRYAADGTGSREISGVIAINNAAAVKAYSVLPFPFASSAEHVEIDYIRVRRPDGTILVTPTTDAQEMPAAVTREAPFYSDLKEEQIPVRSLREGDHLEYKIRIVRTRAEAPGHFWGEESFFKPSSGLIALSEDFELHIPKPSYVQVWSPSHQPVRADTADEQVYKWHSSQLLPVAGKSANALLLLDKEPEDGEPKLPQIAWTNFHTWAEVGAWYRSMEGHRVEPDDTIRAKVKELTAGLTTPEAKARALYGYDSTQVRYIGVAFGIGRYQPHEASEILSNQYGDCKDKHTLLASMLDAAGISSDAVLIGAGIAFNEAVPSPGAFNHAITLAHIDGKPVWLDATSELAPYRLLNPVLRGKKALVIPLDGEAHIDTTPTELPFTPFTRFEANGSLDDQGTSHSHIVIDVRGDDEVGFREGVQSVSRGQWDELMQRISQLMSYSGKVTNTDFSRPNDTATPFRASYDYEREKNGDWEHLQIIPQLYPVVLSDVDEKDPPVMPIELGTPHVETSHAVMALPKGWSATLPDDVHAKSAFATLDKTYKLVDGAVVTDRRFEVLQKNVPANQWHSYHAWYKAAGLSDGELYIQLSKHTISIPNNPAFPFPSHAEVNEDAADLVRQAVADEQKHDWSAAHKQLDKAKSINSEQAFLWSNYGYIAMVDHKTDEAIKDFRREIVSHPDEPNAYILLAAVFMQQHKTGDTIAVLRSSLIYNTDENIVLRLQALLITSNGDYAGAAKILRDAHKALPDSAAIKMRLGIALVHLDTNEDKHDGETILLDILDHSEDPGQLNDAAYALANASLDLSEAETASRHSLDLLDAASSRGETDHPALLRASLIVSAWDRLGWILFQEAKTKEAEPWVLAAWSNGFGGEPGYHLAAIYKKQGRQDDALSTLELAKGTSTGTNAEEVKKLITDMTKELIAAGAKADQRDLQNMRTYEFPVQRTPSKGDNWATIELAVTTAGTDKVVLMDGDNSLMQISDTIKAFPLNLKVPQQSHATLLRRGVLSCHTSTTCQLVLLSTHDAANEN